jgi:hypothetical protein
MAVKPYQILNLNLSNANTAGYPVYGQFGLIRVLNARTSSGGIASDVVIEMQPEELPRFDVSLGQAALMSDIRRWMLYWDAQPGVTVQIGLSADPGQIDWDMDPPTQLVVTGTDPLAVDLDQGRDKTTRDGEAFVGGAQQAGVGGQYSLMVLRNPVGSSKILYLDKIRASVSSASVVVPRIYGTAALATGGFETNLDFGGAAGVGDVSYEANAAVPTSTNMGLAAYCAANVPVETVFSHPVRLGAGEGIMLVVETVNVALTGSFFWRELSA